VGGCEYGILVEKAGRLRYRARESVEMHEVVMKIDRHAEVKDKVCIVFCKARNEEESCTKFLHTVSRKRAHVPMPDTPAPSSRTVDVELRSPLAKRKFEGLDIH
jgi:hypothetical protein